MIEIRVPVRYSDLDRYGHVSSSRYLDMVEEAIFLPRAETAALRQQLGGLIPHLVRLSYKRPIAPVSAIRVVLKLATSDPLVLEFSLLAVQEETVHATGQLEFCAADQIRSTADIAPRTKNANHGMPVLYDHVAYTRFDDIGARSDLALGRPVDLVLASRLHYFRTEYDLSVSKLSSRGIGLFLTGCEVKSDSVIDEAERIRITSWTAEVTTQDSELIVPFQGVTETDNRLCFSGHLNMAIVDLTATRPRRTAMPSWLKDMLFEKSPLES